MTKFFTAVYFCLALLCAANKAKAQSVAPSAQDWDALHSITLGTKLRVERKDGKRITRELAAISDTEITLAHKGKPEIFRRDEVRKVWRVDPPNHAKRAIFTGVGAGAGLMFGLALSIALGFHECGGSCADEGAGIIAAIVGLPIGGALAGRALAGHRDRLLYAAP